MIAEVAFPVPIHKTFYYKVPPDMHESLKAGMRVRAPFGRRQSVGVVTGIHADVPIALRALRELEAVIDPFPLYGPELMELSHWMSSTWGSPIGVAISALLPACACETVAESKGNDGSKTFYSEAALRWKAEGSPAQRGNGKQRQEAKHPCPLGQATEISGGQSAILGSISKPQSFAEGGGQSAILGSISKPQSFAEGGGQSAILGSISKPQSFAEGGGTPSTFELTPGQKSVLETLEEMLRSGNFGAALLFGTPVTGKTEVYIRLIQEVLAGRGQPAIEKYQEAAASPASADLSGTGSRQSRNIGKPQSFAKQGQVLFLVPDIALTEPFLDEIFSRFDPSLTVCWHSRMTPAARKRAWSEIASGEKRVVLGTRSACLLPFRALSLAVIDEEQDESYKQEEASPNYHARDVLLWRARRHGALVVAGSATPSLESYQGALSGKWKLLRLTERVSPLKSFPEVIVVDRRKYPRKLISDVMAGHLKEALARKEQSILLTNRRGYSSSFVCLNCGWLVRCGRCAIAMSMHRSPPSRNIGKRPQIHQERAVPGHNNGALPNGEGTDDRVLVCHRCGAQSPPPQVCPKCSNRIFKHSGAGTQKVEQEVRRIVPQAGIVRLDSDTSRKVSGQGRQAYKRFSRLQADILIGTRAVSRGYHFPDVTFIGVVDADTELHSPDFRAAEKTVQMLCQAQGRAGRAEKPGKMVIQTFDPDNYAFSGVTALDYEKFARHELEIRRQLGYPPFRRLLRCIVCARDENHARKSAQSIMDSLIQSVEESGLLSSENIDILGPVQCVRKSQDSSRYHFIVKSLSERGIIFCSEQLQKTRIPKGAKIRLFTDPYDFR